MNLKNVSSVGRLNQIEQLIRVDVQGRIEKSRVGGIFLGRENEVLEDSMRGRYGEGGDNLFDLLQMGQDSCSLGDFMRLFEVNEDQRAWEKKIEFF